MSLVGRSKELDRVLSVIRGPKDSALVVSGSRGSGRSALLAELSALCEYPTVFLSASESESGWPLSGITALLNRMDDPVLNRIADELLRDAADTPNVPALSATLLSGLLQRSSTRTVIAIDDADRLDPGSQAVIGFLARRLSGTDIALFLSVRGSPPDGPFTGLDSLKLNPLSYNETVRMLEAIPANQGTTAAAHAVASATLGNPLAAVELYHHLLEQQADGKYAMPIPLPCRGSFETDFAAVVGQLAPAARGILDLLSLSCRTDIGALEQVNGDVWSGVDELLSEGLVSRTGPHLRIRDQLLRGYVFSTMAPAARTASHRALANASELSDPYARRWHLSYTALERKTAFSLLRHAVDLIRGGDVPFAVEYIERALTLNPWEAETAARLAAIAEVLFSHGEFVYARRYLDWALRVTRNPPLILRLTGLAFEIQFAQGASVRSSMVLRLAKEFGRHSPAFTAALLAGAALYYAERWELADAAEVLRRSAAFRDAASAECRAITDRAQTLTDAIRGDTASLARKHEPAGEARMVSLLVQGRALSYAEAYPQAQQAFAIVAGYLEPRNTLWRETALVLAVDNEIRAGNVGAAIRLIDDLERSDPEMKYQRGQRCLFRVWRAHAVGDEARAKVHAADAQQFAASGNNLAIAAQFAAMEGHFALLRGDLAESCAYLSRASELGQAFANPVLLRCEADLVEVLVRLGRHREATQVLQRLEAHPAGLRSLWLVEALARCHAMLADGEQALQLFSQAIEAGKGHVPLVERGRTLLCYSERLSAFGRLRDSKDALLRAKVLFDEAGAASWAQHVDVLLMDDREERPRGNPALLLLASHELELAKMVARGMRNKEIAGTLYVSVRTVEVRLTAIYRKLGVESRAQLTALAAGKSSPSAEPYVLPIV